MSTTPDLAAEEAAWPRTVDAALLRWDNEGGAGPQGAQDRAPLSQRDWLTANTRIELARLRGRVMVSKPLLMAVLASASDRHLDSIRESDLGLSRLPCEALRPAGMLAFTKVRQIAGPVGYFPVAAPA